MQHPAPSILTRGPLGAIAYHRSDGRAPGVVFLPGFRSDMSGAKALALEGWCGANGRGFLRFDYTGHGRSEGRFEDGTIGAWRDDALAVLDRLSAGPQILVGSSMGGWIMLLVALARPQRIAGLVGIAAAPDFGSAILNSLDAAARTTLRSDGVVRLPSAYSDEPTPITARLVAEARRHELLLGRIAIRCPVRLIHGTADPDVPWRTSLKIAEQLDSADVEILLVKNGGHRLSEPHDLERMIDTVAALCRHTSDS